MGTFWNIRGTNGSGKTTLVRAFLPDNGGGAQYDWGSYDKPTKRDPERRLTIPGYVHHYLFGAVAIVGSYATPTGGFDGLPSFDVQRKGVGEALAQGYRHVLGEGVLASTVYGSWAEFDRALEADGHCMAWVYLHTPVELCLQRIAERQRAAGRERLINEALVRDKVRAIQATRQRALDDGRPVYDIPNGNAAAVAEALRMMMRGEGEVYRAA